MDIVCPISHYAGPVGRYGFSYKVDADLGTLRTMGISLALLGVDQVVVHEVPASEDGGGAEPILSEVLEDPGQETRDFFRDRAVESLKAAGRSVHFQKQPKSPVPDSVRRYLDSSEPDLLTMSQECARHLAACQQSGTISAGLLCVADCSYKKVRGVALVKLESEEGVQLKRGRVKGKRSLSMQNVKDLILSQRTRVFKVGLFVSQASSVTALLSDHQVPRTSTRGAARFFLDDFLGCELAELPDVTTARFYEAARDFINSLEAPEQQYTYDAALHAELMSSAPGVHPSTFARKHLAREHRGAFQTLMAERRIPDSGFDKDTTRIGSHLKKRLIEFRSGLRLAGPSASFDEHVAVEDDGQAVVVRDEIAKLGHRT